MALGKTVSYTPFNETSFGYGSDEIATAHATEFPNATDIVKVTIEYGTGNWDTTGHLSTPSVGTAVAVYNEIQQLWVVKGERDDVDAVLAAMSFFPADKAETREWDPTDNALKDNVTSGNYGPTEEPPEIGNTSFTLKVFDGATQVSSQFVIFSVTEAVFGNQRPFFSVVPATEDLNSSAHDAVAGGLVDFGTISHGTDTENVQVKCEFRHYGSTTQYTGGQYGTFTQDSNIFIGDKKPATRNFTDSRFNFTGSVAEAQAFLDNIRYYNSDNETTFDMFLTITDGVVGSTLTKTCYFSDALITVSTLPDVSYYEDENSTWFESGILTFGNIQNDVTQFSATVTFDATGHSGIQSGTFGTGTYVNNQPLTTTRSTLAELKNDLSIIELTMVSDFDSDFTYTVDFTFSNPTLGTSYTAAQQTVNVSGEPRDEISNPITLHTWTEDQRYDFPNSVTPQIIHGRNEQFDVIFTLSDADAGVLARHGTNAFFTDSYGTSAQYKLQGTRDEINLALQNLYFAPSADYDDNFTITFTVDRTSGDLTYATQATGSFQMNAIAASEFSFPLTNPEINWENNVTTRFNSGLQITDTADETIESPIYNSTYTVVARLKIDGSAFTDGKLTSEYTNLITLTNDYSNEITFTGSKTNVNIVLQELRFIPDPLYDELHDFYVEYKVTRDADNVVLEGVDFSPNVRTDFKNPTITQPVSFDTQLFDWEEDTPFEFDSKFSITEKLTENTDYTTANGYDSWNASYYRVTLNGSQNADMPEMNWTTTTLPNANLTVSGIGTYGNPLILEGSKAEINKAFATLKMIPTVPDFTTSSYTNGSFWAEFQLKRLRDNSVIVNYSPRLANFNAGTNISEYRPQWTNTIYTEDIQGQYIFAHLDDFIQDGAGDLFDATYDVSIGLGNETTGKFVPYVDDGYLVDDDINIFVDDFEVRLVGTKAEINEAIKQIQFSPFPDVYATVEIRYAQTRIYNNVSVIQAENALVASMPGIETPEYVMGTAIFNTQFFVQDENLIGLDLTGTNSVHRGAGGDATLDNLNVSDDILNDNAFVTLTPKQISSNVQFPYDAPITVTDTYVDGGESLYKVIFDGGNLFTAKNEDLTTLGASLNITDTGWQPKETLNSILANGIYVTGVSEANENIPLHGSTYNVTFTVYRKTASGTETQLTGHRSLTYFFLSGLTCWSGQTGQNRIDNLTTDYIQTPLMERFEFKDSRGERRISSQGNYGLPLYGRAYDIVADEWSTVSNLVYSNDNRKIHENIDSGIVEFTLHTQEAVLATDYVGRDDDVWLYVDTPGNAWKPINKVNADTTEQTQIQLLAFTQDGQYLKVGSSSTDESTNRLFLQNKNT